MTADFLIVGQGVAGSVLAWTLDKRGCSVILVDDPTRPSASGVAAGIVNPLTGRKLVRTWKADELFPFLHQFYRHIEQALNVRFFHPKTIYRPFRSIAEKTSYESLTDNPAIQPYVADSTNHAVYDQFINNPFGGLAVTQAGWLDVNEFVRVIKGYFIQKNQYADVSVNINELVFSDGKVTWQGIVANKIIFCDGAQMGENPLFNWLPYNPVKGEIITAVMPDYTISSIVNQGLFILPIRDGVVKIGATYSWHDIDWKTTGEGRTFLETKVRDILKVPFEVVAQQAGIRPSTKDRRPFVGLHPTQAVAGIFGGMGTKGVSLAPYLAEQFSRHLLDGEDLEPEANISRYDSLINQAKKELGVRSEK